VIESGVVGINIEDSLAEGGALREIGDQCERIAAIREVSAALGIHLVINARVDTFVSNLFPTKETKIREAVVRATAYSEAGADCVYPMGPGDVETVKVLRRRIDSPINILAAPDATPLPVLHELGVNRVSFGPYIFRSCLKKFVDIVDALHGERSYDCFGAKMMSRTDVDAYLIHEHE
jgi:2-methylisocitrate lyase-like PEP mutase family enzyme